MEMAEAFIFDAGWLFFVAWGVVLAAVSVMAFGQEIVSRAYSESDEKNNN